MFGLYGLFSHSVSLSLSLSAVLAGSADCGDTSTVASCSSFGFFVLGPHGLLLGCLHFARKYLSTDDGMSWALGLVTWFSCLKMLLQTAALVLNHTHLMTHHPTRCRRRNAEHIQGSGIWSVLTADMKPATVWLLAWLDAYIYEVSFATTGSQHTIYTAKWHKSRDSTKIHRIKATN